MRLEVQSFRASLVEGGTTHALWLLLGAVGCLLLVTCANVANLQLVRAEARRREVGVRLALGASRARILRLCLTESLLLAGIGGGLGVLVAAWGVDAVAALLPAGSSPFQDEIRLSLPVLWFALGVAVLTGGITGLLPAWMASRQDPAGSLAAGSRGAAGGSGGTRVRATLVVAEIALALMLLAGAGLMGRSFLATLHTPAGLRTERTLMLNLSIPEPRYSRGPARLAYIQRLLDNMSAAPGVTSVGLSTTEPFNWSIPMDFLLPGQAEQTPDTARQHAAYDAVNPAFFSTLDIPILRGRALNLHDKRRRSAGHGGQRRLRPPLLSAGRRARQPHHPARREGAHHPGNRRDFRGRASQRSGTRRPPRRCIYPVSSARNPTPLFTPARRADSAPRA